MKKNILFIVFSGLVKLSMAQNIFPNTGNAGVGTTEPLTALDIRNGHILIKNLANQDNESAIMIDHSLGWGPYANFGTSLRTFTENGAYNIYALQFFTQQSYETGQTEKMRINGNGNVGIGTANPLAKLDVNGNLRSFNSAYGQKDNNTSSKNYANFSSNNHGTVLISSNLYVSGNDDQIIANTHPSMSGASIVIPGNGRNYQGGIVFYTNQPASVTEGQAFTGSLSMAIQANGNVGIGTATPREKLSVNGNIRAREIKVEQNNWPDYVFGQDYKLAGLQELEEYIKTNKHLPDMPSAKEVAAKGLSISEMMRMQQEKIEELTLYIINLKKVSIDQQKEIDLLKKDHLNK